MIITALAVVAAIVGADVIAAIITRVGLAGLGPYATQAGVHAGDFDPTTLAALRVQLIATVVSSAAACIALILNLVDRVASRTPELVILTGPAARPKVVNASAVHALGVIIDAIVFRARVHVLGQPPFAVELDPSKLHEAIGHMPPQSSRELDSIRAALYAEAESLARQQVIAAGGPPWQLQPKVEVELALRITYTPRNRRALTTRTASLAEGYAMLITFASGSSTPSGAIVSHVNYTRDAVLVPTLPTRMRRAFTRTRWQE
ncbi:MAG: hypothetical protein H3C53_12860 [Trueperaceae bacterium]|nr:hypothetical protein [Trueperaceae bacterium]